MLCNDISEAVGLSHRCNRRKCQTKGSKNPNKIFSTKNEKDHEFITLLYQKMSGNILPSGRSSRSIIVDVEKKLWWKVWMLLQATKVNRDSCRKKRKLNTIIGNKYEAKNKKRDDAPVVSELINDKLCCPTNNEKWTQELHIVVNENETDDEELASLLNSPASPLGSSPETTLSSTTTSSSTRANFSSFVLPRPLFAPPTQTSTNQTRRNSKDIFLQRFCEVWKLHGQVQKNQQVCVCVGMQFDPMLLFVTCCVWQVIMKKTLKV